MRLHDRAWAEDLGPSARVLVLRAKRPFPSLQIPHRGVVQLREVRFWREAAALDSAIPIAEGPVSLFLPESDWEATARECVGCAASLLALSAPNEEGGPWDLFDRAARSALCGDDRSARECLDELASREPQRGWDAELKKRAEAILEAGPVEEFRRRVQHGRLRLGFGGTSG